MNRRHANNLNVILEFLIQNGNKLSESKNRQTDSHGGSKYELKRNIDFKLLKEKFCFSENLVIDEEKDYLFDRNTWNVLHGPDYSN